MVEGYIGVSLPKDLIDQVEKEIKTNKDGYQTITEFIKVAIREKLQTRLPTQEEINLFQEFKRKRASKT